MEIRGPLMRVFSVMRRSLCSAAADASEVAKVKTKRKKKTLFEVTKFLPDWGIGYKFFKTHWDPNVYYELTRINLYKDGIHGKAWGIFHKNGMPKPKAPQKISGVNKRVWRYINDMRNKTAETKQKNAIEA
ncbi:hypothetical protein SUGI_0829630 [Cryptomeria japonica]|uniref:uncharacterized protein LOC131064677 isoform X2 n=1 Tax=Cryptomeria japonica TaxID=3369 RepID=UPI0024146B0B|nr:uncharacterized protein LOC131064677 isoform X2 [Cryptomeria japonica]GLJ40349.1 hypothetical protein SUGI_0829630 [Cryptomeria japonica]